MDQMLEKFKKFLDSEEGKALIEEAKKSQEKYNKLKNDRLEWFNSIGEEKRNKYIQKVIDKYTSKEYKDRWYSRGMFPQEELYWWIYDYAYKYGRCWHAIPDEVGPGFTYKFVFDNWKVLLYNGQGSIVIISKVTDEDIKRGPDEWAQYCLGHEYEKEYYENLTDEFA